MEGFCRGCLIKYDEPMDLLQYTEKNRRLFVYSTGLQVKRNDTFTFQLCKDCYINMKLSCKFKKLCRTSDKRFKHYLGLKDVGDPIDFSTFLKNNDDTMTFRLPMTSGNSTPFNQKCKDDDNESTCTSIRNFMTDILQGEEMPDTEARIIREVIEEEADVLDDSLDSHWLQDDMSIDTDFRLDFSFSPFSTPRTVNNDRCYTPKKLTDQNEEQPNFYPEISKKQSKFVNDFTNAFTTAKNEKVLSDFNKDAHDTILETETLKTVHSIKKYCNFGTDECDSVEKLKTNAFKSVTNVKELCNFSTVEKDSIEESNTNAFTINQNSKELCDFSIDQIDGFDKSQSSIDLPALDEIDIGKSACNIELPSLDSVCNDKSESNIDLITLSELVTEKSKSNIHLPTIEDLDKNQINIQTFYTPKDDVEHIHEMMKDGSQESINIDDLLKDKQCTIDINLEKALENKDSKQFSLDDLLVSPKVIPGASAASTPTITNILFGEKLDSVENTINPKLEDVQVDIEIFEEFFQNDTKEFDIEDIERKNVKIEDIKKPIDFDNMVTVNGKKSINNNIDKENEVNNEISAVKLKKVKIEIDITTEMYEDKFDIENCYCCLCKKKYKSSRALSIHLSRTHDIKIITPKKSYTKMKLCNLCGKDIAYINFERHFKRCKLQESDDVFKCERCPIVCTSQSRLDRHMSTHTLTFAKKRTRQEHVCSICGIVITKSSNYKLHLRRHTKNYVASCQVCGKGFYTTFDLTAHMRSHTGDTPFACAYCPRLFSRKDVLNKHIKIHMGERLYKCDYCGKKEYRKCELRKHIKSQVCIKPDLLKDNKEKDIDDEKPGEEQVTVINAMGDDNSITNQLPFLETELSN